MELFKIFGTLALNGADKTEEQLDSTTEKAGNLKKAFGTAGKVVGGLTVAAGAAGAAVYGMATSSAATADNIDKMSQKIGISREAYQELDFICSQSGTSVDTLQMGIKSLTAAMDGAASGTKSNIEQFEKLGVAVTNADGSMRSQEDVMWDTFSALQGMENQTEKARLATELFGRSGSELMPLLNSGAGSIEEMKQTAHELGLVLGDDVVDSGVELTDTLDQMKRSFSAVGANLGGVLMPIVKDVAQFVIDNMPVIQNAMQQIAPVFSAVFQQLIPPLLELASTLLPILISLFNAVMPIIAQLMTDLMPVIVQLLQILLPPIIQIVETLLPPLLALLQPIIDLLSPLIELLQPILDLVTAVLEPIATLITDLITPLISIITELIQDALVPLKWRFEMISEAISNTFSSAVEFVMARVEMIKGVFSGVIQFIKGVFTGNWKSAWQGVQKIFSSIWEGIKSAFKIPINWIISGINTFIRGINKIKIPDWVPLVGGKGFSISEIPELEQGGILEKGQTGFLEGNGAEAVVPLHQNKKWIHAVAEDMDNAVGGSGAAVQALLSDILDQLKIMADKNIMLDTGALVGALANPMDARLGKIRAQKARA